MRQGIDLIMNNESSILKNLFNGYFEFFLSLFQTDYLVFKGDLLLQNSYRFLY
jgi:hypothetical protein